MLRNIFMMSLLGWTLCRDGSASYYSSNCSGSITGSLSVSSSGEGSWEIEDASGEEKFYSNGARYYREWNGC